MGQDRKVLKAAGVLVAKRHGVRGFAGLKKESTVLTFKLCDIGESLNVSAEDIGGGKIMERLAGVPVFDWDTEWIKLIEKLEVEGKELNDDF